jgi:hypothetical protein
MRNFVAVVLVFFACIDSAATAQKALEIGPTTFKDGVPILIDSQGPYLFGLDTGASTAFYINPSLAAKLALPVVSHTHIHTSSDEVPGSAPQVDVLRIDDLAVAGHLFHHAIGVAYSTAENGTLGIGLFKDVLLTLDFPNDHLSISEDQLPVADGKTIFPYVQDHTIPVVPVTLGDMQVQARLDTGARKTEADVMIPLSMATQLHFVTPMQEAGTVQDAVGRNYKRYTAILDGDLTIGTLVVHHPTLLVSDFLPYVNLGGLCNRLRIQLDQSHGLIGISLSEKISSASATNRLK